MPKGTPSSAEAGSRGCDGPNLAPGHPEAAEKLLWPCRRVTEPLRKTRIERTGAERALQGYTEERAAPRPRRRPAPREEAVRATRGAGAVRRSSRCSRDPWRGEEFMPSW